MSRALLSIVLIIAFSLKVVNVSGQSEIVKIIYADQNFMEKEVYGDFWKLKNGVQDGDWIIFYDSNLNDTAVIVAVNDGVMEGKCLEWDKETQQVRFEINYLNGLRNGVCRAFYRKGNVIYAFEEKWVNGLPDEVVSIERIISEEEYNEYITR